jgi:hypothetical protein
VEPVFEPLVAPLPFAEPAAESQTPLAQDFSAEPLVESVQGRGFLVGPPSLSLLEVEQTVGVPPAAGMLFALGHGDGAAQAEVSAALDQPAAAAAAGGLAASFSVEAEPPAVIAPPAPPSPPLQVCAMTYHRSFIADNQLCRRGIE